jgi:hypothetical protein
MVRMNSAIRSTDVHAGVYGTSADQRKRKKLGVAALRIVCQSVYYTEQEWALVQKAASLEGISRSEFVALAAVQQGQRTLKRHDVAPTANPVSDKPPHPEQDETDDQK